jgi:hypothetical protein
MKRLVLATVGALALAGAGIAASGIFAAKSVKSVTGTFTATTVSGLHSTTCTNADGTFVDSRATYSGVATSSEPSLNGPIRLDVHSVVNTTKDLGTASGRLTIDTSSARNTVGRFQAVYSGGSLAGLAGGHTDDPATLLLANLSAGFSATGGFTGGKLGASSGGAAIEGTLGPCAPKAAPGKPQTVEVHGVVTGLTSTRITAGGVTCTIPSNRRVPSNVAVNSQVEMRCTLVNGQYVLTKLEAKGKGEGKGKHH